MRTIKLLLAYDGAAFCGWQVQPEGRSVQGTLEAAILRITGESRRVTASGRTDAGVHALGQVAAFSTTSTLSPEVLSAALNAELPEDVAVLAVEEVDASFDPIRHARRKRYRYLIYDGQSRDIFTRRVCWHIYSGRLDVAAMQRAALPLLGTHDFSSYESSGAERATSVRTVFALEIKRGWPELTNISQQGTDDRITLEIEADGFLYNMVRAIVGTLVEVGRGMQDETWPARALAACDRRAAGPTAPAQGLFLVRVDY